MADSKDGIDLMRSRMARAQRVPPTARRPAAAPSPAPAGETEVPETPRTAAPTAPRATAERPARRAAAPASRRPRVSAADPPVNLAIRVRRPLDEHLVDILHDLRKAGVRSSKVELIEMLLWELPADPAAVRGRLADFRRAAPRGTDAA